MSFLLLHEMDAIDKREWHLLFVLRRLPDRTGLRWFVLLHLPLYVGLLVLVAAESSPVVRWLEGGVDVFLVVHAGLHARLSGGGGVAFANAFSGALIGSAAALGLLHLALLVADIG